MATNTEKPASIAEKKKQIVDTPKKKVETPKAKKPTEKKNIEEKPVKEEKGEEKQTEEKKKPVKGTEKPKTQKSEAVVIGTGVPISTKYAIAICRFIKNKKIGDAILDLEQVANLKKAVPMRGEIPHRKGKIMSGRFPKKASQQFIYLLKSLQANSNVNELEEPIIVEAIANLAPRPYGRFGAVKRKRTHIKIMAKSKNKEKIGGKIKSKKKTQ